MKKILLFLTAVLISATILKTSGQGGCMGGANNCELAITNTIITINESRTICDFPSVGKMTVVFDAEFDLTYNSGNKLIYFHSWLSNDYPAYFPCSNGSQSAPTNANGAKLGGAIDQPGMSFLDIGLDNNVARGAAGVPVNVPILTSYSPDPAVVLISTANDDNAYPMTCTKTFLSGSTDHVVLKNVTVIINLACGSLIDVKSDVWSTNGANGTTAQCWIAGLGQTFNQPQISLQKKCGSTTDPDVPFKYSVGIATSSVTDLTVTYRVYMEDLDGIKEPSGGAGSDQLIFTSAPIVINASTPFSSGDVTLPPPFCCIEPYAQWGMFVLVTVQGYSNNFGTPIVIQDCATLPIKLRSFDAARNRSNVNVKWETEIEINNKGFYLERKLSTGVWHDITFIPSKASNGNSNSVLTYDFTDLNNTKGISQYRLRQVDIDGKLAYSQIRSVRGEGQKSNTIIYPNPSGDGKVNIVFEGTNSMRDVSLMDVSGKTLKQWKGVTNNNIQIDNLNAGFYTVRIVNIETGEQVVEKFIVNKR